MFISHDDSRIDPCSPSGLCGICEQPVMLADAGLATYRHGGTDYAYLCCASCLMSDEGFDYDDEEEE